MSSESIVFDRAAGFYDATRGFPDGVEQEAAALIARVGHIDAESRVLEVGVGTGRIALPLAQVSGATVIGLDLSAAMMQRLREKRQQEAVHTAQADITHLPLPGQSFRRVMATHVFHLIPPWQTALAEVMRVLTADGLFLNCWNGVPDSQPFERLLTAWNSVVPPEQETTVGIPRGRFADFPLDEGWEPVGETQTIYYTEAQTPAAFIERYEKRISSASWVLDDALVAAGVAAIRAAAAEQFDDLHQPVTVTRTYNVRAFAPPPRG